MRLSVSSTLILPLLAMGNPLVTDNQLSRRADGHIELYKRFSNSRWTYYSPELGACGQNINPSDFAVALNAPQYGTGYPGPNCFKKITMTYNGKTATATIMDECPGCPDGGLDLTPGLFSFFSSTNNGIIYGDWNFVS